MDHAFNGKHRISVLLTEDENEQIFQLLRPNGQSIATTVVQMYSTDGPDGVHWIKRYVGILCLVRDIDMQSYFFRLFCLVQNEMIWEQEIYNRIQYLAPTSFLHTFEAEDCIVAFNFANEGEAAFLREKVLSVSFDNAKTDFEIENEFKSIVPFFEETGISKKLLKDKRNHEIIHNRKLTPLSSPLLPRTGRESHLKPPPLPSTPRPRSQKKTAPIPTVRPSMSPPAPLICPPPPPVPPRTMPPDPFIFVPSSTTISGSYLEAYNDSRSALMEAIRRGTTLQKSVEVKAEADGSKSKTDNFRGDLLDAIRKGVKLKAVQPNTKLVHNSVLTNSLVSALTRALAERAKALQSDSSEASETSDTNDDDWND